MSTPTTFRIKFDGHLRPGQVVELVLELPDAAPDFEAHLPSFAASPPPLPPPAEPIGEPQMAETVAVNVSPHVGAIAGDLEAWIADLRRRRRSMDYIRRGPAIIRELITRFGWQASAEATPAQICTWLAEKGGTGQAQNNRIAMIRAYFRYCQSVLRSVSENPAANIERSEVCLGEGMREFTPAEMVALFQAATGHWRVAVGLLATTALRRGAVFRGVRCGWFSHADRALVIPAGFLKNRKAQSIPLNDDAMELLTEATRGRDPSEPIVPIAFDKGSWMRLLKRAGVPHIDGRGRRAGIHSFRKGVLTTLAEAGVYPKVLQDLAGHSDFGTTMRHYARIDAKAQVEAVAMLPSLVKSCRPLRLAE